MNTQNIISEIKNEFESDNENFENYFADAVESANNSAIDSTSEAFNIGDYDGISFWEDGVNGIEDEKLRKKVDAYYFDSFERSLRTKVKSFLSELA